MRPPPSGMHCTAITPAPAPFGLWVATTTRDAGKGDSGAADRFATHYSLIACDFGAAGAVSTSQVMVWMWDLETETKRSCTVVSKVKSVSCHYLATHSSRKTVVGLDVV